MLLLLMGNLQKLKDRFFTELVMLLTSPRQQFPWR